MKPQRSHIQRGIAVGLSVCLLAVVPGREVYGTLGQIQRTGAQAPELGIFNKKEFDLLKTPSFIYFLAIRGFQPNNFLTLPAETQEKTRLEYLNLVQEALALFKTKGLLMEPYVDLKGEITPFGLWTALFLKENPDRNNLSFKLLAKKLLKGLSLKKTDSLYHRSLSLFENKRHTTIAVGSSPPRSFDFAHGFDFAHHDPERSRTGQDGEPVEPKRGSSFRSDLDSRWSLPAVAGGNDGTKSPGLNQREYITNAKPRFNKRDFQKLSFTDTPPVPSAQDIQTLLNDQQALAQADEKDRKLRDLAAELAVAKRLEASLNEIHMGGDPRLAGRIEDFKKTQAHLTQAIERYQIKQSQHQDLKKIYEAAVLDRQKERGLQELIKKGANLIQVLQLMFANDLLGKGLQKLNQLMSDADQVLAENSQRSQELEGEKQWAAQRLQTAQKYYDDALAGKFTDQTQDFINQVNEAIARANQALSDANGMINGNWMNLTATFLQPESVDEEIKTWQEVKDKLGEQLNKAKPFVDVNRDVTAPAEDEFGDKHPASIHYWIDDIQRELDEVEAIINMSLEEFKRIDDIEKNLDQFYIGEKGNPKRQATPEHKKALLTWKEGKALVQFGYAVIRYKVAESTLNALRSAYAKDANFPQDYPDAFVYEAYYETTLSSIERAKDQAKNRVLTKINQSFNLEKGFLADLLAKSGNADAQNTVNKLIDMVNTQYQSEELGATVKQGFAHRGMAMAEVGVKLAQDSLQFAMDKKNFLNSGPSVEQILSSQIIEKQKDLAERQLDFAQNKLLPFLVVYLMPAMQSETKKWEGFVQLYRDGYTMFFDAKGQFNQVEKCGFGGAEDFGNKETQMKECGSEGLKDYLRGILDPLRLDYNNISLWLSWLNPKDNPAIRQTGQALSAVGDETMRVLEKKKHVIQSLEELQEEMMESSKGSLKNSLEKYRIARSSLKKTYDEVSPDDPNWAVSQELLNQGDLFANQVAVGDKSLKPQPFFLINKSDLNQLFLKARLSGGKPPQVADWISALGVSPEMVFPAGDTQDGFYLIMRYSMGLNPQAVDEVEQDAFLKFGNVGQILGGNIHLSLYDYTDAERPPRGARGFRLTHERNKPNERFINTTSLDVHQFLQQGEVLRLMVYEDMAFMLLGDRLFVGLTGYGDFPTRDPNETPLASGIQSPYAMGGRGKAIVYLSEIAKINGEMIEIFAKDPSRLLTELNISLDPTKPKYEQMEIQGKELRYSKKHAGLEIDLGKLISRKQTLAVEFFYEEEQGTDYDKRQWKGSKFIKEIHIKDVTLRAQSKLAWDQTGKLEPSGQIAFYLPKGIVLEAQGADYDGEKTGKVALRLVFGPSEAFISYGNDRIQANPKLMIGGAIATSLSQIRTNARKKAQELFDGGSILSGFNKALDRALKPKGGKASVAPTLNKALYETFKNDASIRSLQVDIARNDQIASDIGRFFDMGVGVQAGYIFGHGYQDPLSGKPQNGPGYTSSAGGIKVGGSVWAKLTQKEKEKAVVQLFKVKSALMDLKKAHEDTLNEFRLSAFKLVLAKLRLAQIREMAHDFHDSPALKSRLLIEELKTKAEFVEAQNAIKIKAGLKEEDPLPREIEEIPINPKNPTETFAALAKALEVRDGWKSFLKKLAQTESKLNPKKTGMPSPLAILPFVDDLTLDAGGNIWDMLGNSFAGVGGTLSIALWDPEKRINRRVDILEAKAEAYLYAQKKQEHETRRNPYLIRQERESLEDEKQALESHIRELKAQDLNRQTLAQKALHIEKLAQAQKELARIYLDTLALPEISPSGNDPQKVSIGDINDLYNAATKAMPTLSYLSARREMALKMAEAGKERWRLAARFGLRWNPVTNFWFETATQGFVTSGFGRYLPALDLNIKSRKLSVKDQEVARALEESTQLESDLARLDLAREIAFIYTRLIYGKAIQKELNQKINNSADSQEKVRYLIEVKELERLLNREALRLGSLLNLDISQKMPDIDSLDTRELAGQMKIIESWLSSKVKNASTLEPQALEARLKLAQAFEGRARLSDKARGFGIRPFWFIFDAVAELTRSLLSSVGEDAVSSSTLQEIAALRQSLEDELRVLDEKSKARRQRAKSQLQAREKELALNPSLKNSLEHSLAYLNSVVQGADKTGALPAIASFDRQRPFLGRVEMRLYKTKDYKGKIPVDSKSGFYDRSMIQDVERREGILEVLLSQPELVKPRYLVQAEVIDRYKRERANELNERLKSARLAGLVWKYHHLRHKLSHENQDKERSIIEQLLQETETLIKVEFGKEPKDIPDTRHAPATPKTTDWESLTNIALSQINPDSSVTKELEAELAQGSLEAQSVVSSLRALSLRPSFVFGYIANNYTYGLFINPARENGSFLNNRFDRDMDRIFSKNLRSVLQTKSLTDQARERITSNFSRAQALAQAYAEILNFMTSLKGELDRNPDDKALFDLYYQTFEESLNSSAELNALYLELASDLELLGVKAPKYLGRSSREPWTFPQKREGLTLSEAFRWAKEKAGSPVVNWGNWSLKEKRLKVAAWAASLESKLNSLSSQAKIYVQDLADDIRRAARLPSSKSAEKFYGVLVGLRAQGSHDYRVVRPVSLESWQDLKTLNSVFAYNKDSGALLDYPAVFIDSSNSRLLAAPGNFKDLPPKTLAEASKLGFLEFLPSRVFNEERVEDVQDNLAKTRLSQAREKIYHEGERAFSLYRLDSSSTTDPSLIVLDESEALEKVSSGVLKLINTRTNKSIRPDDFNSRFFWMRDRVKLYWDGDYKFVDEQGSRAWTWAELWRDGRLLFFERNPVSGDFKRVSFARLDVSDLKRRDLKILAYFGPATLFLRDVEDPQDLEEFSSSVREILPTAKGEARLKEKELKSLRSAWQAGFVSLKTAYGFALKGDGALDKVFLSFSEYQEVKRKFPKKQLYKSEDLTARLSSSGQIVSIDLKDAAGKNYSWKLSDEPAVKSWKDWAAIEVDKDFLVQVIWDKKSLKNKTPSDWAIYFDREDNPNCPNGLCPINQNRFPVAREMAWVNPKAKRQVLFPSAEMTENLIGTKFDLSRTQAKPWVLTLGFGAEIAREIVMSPWELPFGIGVAGPNMADRVASIRGEGIIHEDNNVLYDVANLVFLWRYLPQIQDRIADPSDYPQTVSKKKSPWYTHIPIIGPILGSKRDAYEVAPNKIADENKPMLAKVPFIGPWFNRPKKKFIEFGAKAIERQLAWKQEDLNVLRQNILSRFQGDGLSLRETHYARGVAGYYPATRTQILTQKEGLTRALEALESLDVHFNEDGSFALQIVNGNSILEGKRIESVESAERNLEVLKERQNNHQAFEKIIEGLGGTSKVVWEKGAVKANSLEAGGQALNAWRKQLSEVFKRNDQVIYDPEFKSFVDKKGAWLFNTEFSALVFFNEAGVVREVYQALWGAETLQKKLDFELKKLETRQDPTPSSSL